MARCETVLGRPGLGLGGLGLDGLGLDGLGLEGPGLGALCHPVPPCGPGVCSVCRGCAHPGFATCRSCARVMAQVSRPCPRVVPVSIYRIPSPLHLVLRRYKDGVSPAARTRDRAVLAALLAHFLSRHGECLRVHGGGSWDLVTTVPSTRPRPWLAGEAGSGAGGGRGGDARLGGRGGGRGGADHTSPRGASGEPPQPLAAALQLVPWLGQQHVSTLARTGQPLAHNLASDAAFAVVRPVAGAAVLLIDDTFTSGARAQSAASALSRAGARVLAIVVAGRVAGRVADPGHDRDTDRYWRRCSSRPFDLEHCALEHCALEHCALEHCALEHCALEPWSRRPGEALAPAQSRGRGRE